MEGILLLRLEEL